MHAIDTHQPAEASPRAIRSAHASVTAGGACSAPSSAGAPARSRPASRRPARAPPRALARLLVLGALLARQRRPGARSRAASSPGSSMLRHGHAPITFRRVSGVMPRDDRRAAGTANAGRADAASGWPRRSAAGRSSRFELDRDRDRPDEREHARGDRLRERAGRARRASCMKTRLNRRDQPRHRCGARHLRARGPLLPRARAPHRRAAGGLPLRRHRTRTAPSRSCSRTSRRPRRATRSRAARRRRRAWRCGARAAARARVRRSSAGRHAVAEPGQHAHAGARRAAAERVSSSATASASPSEHLEVCERFVASLDGWAPERRPPLGLVHGDYRLDNMLFGERPTRRGRSRSWTGRPSAGARR